MFGFFKKRKNDEVKSNNINNTREEVKSVNKTLNLNNKGIGSLNLRKNDILDLSKRDTDLTDVVVGLGWDACRGSSTYDLDAFAIALVGDKLLNSSDICYYGNKRLGRYLYSTGDNLTGEGEGDDEEIVIDLKNLPSKYNKIVIAVNIYRAKEKGQSFGEVENSYIRICDKNTNEEICRYSLEESFHEYTGVIMGELIREENSWEFKAIGKGVNGSVSTIANTYK